mmetsp:Transcript_25372/g.47222  ORF Transcript_25372/g.47222 Transcript_25372/m.47222 type:complete len:125 (-) Transcript_25372:294-668(-)
MAPPWYYPGTPASRRPGVNAPLSQPTGVAGVTSPSRHAVTRDDDDGGGNDGGEVQTASSSALADNHIDVAEEAAAALAAEASEEMGMTAERQREIQASLFKMLGQQDDPEEGEGDNGDEVGGKD